VFLVSEVNAVRFLLLITCLIFFFNCSARDGAFEQVSGHDFSAERAKEIRDGSTSDLEVLNTVGKPFKVVPLTDGKRFEYASVRMRKAEEVRFFHRRLYCQSITKELQVEVSDKGIVRHHRYSEVVSDGC
jgi:hypothetical protein